MDPAFYVVVSDYEFTPERVEALLWIFGTASVVGLAVMVGWLIESRGR